MDTLRALAWPATRAVEQDWCEPGASNINPAVGRQTRPGARASDDEFAKPFEKSVPARRAVCFSAWARFGGCRSLTVRCNGYMVWNQPAGGDDEMVILAPPVNGKPARC